jgi:D-sedoheptulose 7-phosphate isomerase
MSINDLASSYLAYVANLTSIFKQISSIELQKFVDALLLARENNSTIYFIGNGGSASTSSHWVNDLSIGTKLFEKPFRAVSLCDNQSIITAIANDYGYDEIFSRPLSVLLKKGDVLVAISASGNSPNLLTAIDIAKQRGVETVGLTAFNGGKLREMVDISVHVPTNQGEYGPAEDSHMMLDHFVTGYLMNLIKESSK